MARCGEKTDMEEEDQVSRLAGPGAWAMGNGKRDMANKAASAMYVKWTDRRSMWGASTTSSYSCNVVVFLWDEGTPFGARMMRLGETPPG